MSTANSAATYANGAFAAANAATATDTTQNNSITAAFNTANAAFTKANNALANTSGTTFDGEFLIGSGGKLTVLTIGGDEGGEILLGKPVTNTTLSGTGITIDSYQNKLRFFEGSANAQGVFIDLSKTPAGVAGELSYKSSGFVNAGVDVTLGNLKVRMSTSGNRSLQWSTVSGTYSVYCSGVYSQNGVAGTTIDAGAPKSITTTPSYINAGYNFATGGATDCWVVMDTSAGLAWRISLIVGAGYNNNYISIERL